MQAGTTVNVLAAKAVALREAASKAFNEYLDQCLRNASALGQALMNRSLDLWTGGTDYHFLVLSTRPLGLTGLEAEHILEEQGIAARRVAMSFGEGCSNQGDGLLLGTQAVTMKGLKEPDMDDLAEKIYRSLR
jgi:glycine hydroxymethyltransferase